jgi:short-subunit dehydrogenase
MRIIRKKLKGQVMVITGASSGIGLATAKLAAGHGMRLVLSSRHGDALEKICGDLRAAGGEAIWIPADMADFKAVQRVADAAVETFAGIDVWVNNAGVAMFGKLLEVPIEDERRLFDVNYWGVVHGSLAAVPHLKKSRGTLINMGSVASNRALPLRGTYSASKHAVKAFTEALRMELEKKGTGISVTLLKPSSIDTPLPQHARNHMDAAARQPPPQYAPEIVARTILNCAQHKHREVIVGGAGDFLIWLEKLLPTQTDWLVRRFGFRLQREEGVVKAEGDILYHPPLRDGNIRGDYQGPVARRSLYTTAALHPFGTALVTLVLGGLTAVLLTGADSDLSTAPPK